MGLSDKVHLEADRAVRLEQTASLAYVQYRVLLSDGGTEALCFVHASQKVTKYYAVRLYLPKDSSAWEVQCECKHGAMGVRDAHIRCALMTLVELKTTRCNRRECSTGTCPG